MALLTSFILFSVCLRTNGTFEPAAEARDHHNSQLNNIQRVLSTQKITIIESGKLSRHSNEGEKDYYLVRRSIAIVNREARWRGGYLSKSCGNEIQR